MKQLKWLAFVCLSFTVSNLTAQSVDSIRFFTDENPIEMTLTTDIRSLQNEKKINVLQPATVTCRFPDSTVITEVIRVGARGHYRRDNCVIPPLWLNFRNSTSPKLNNLGKLKLVIGCGTVGRMSNSFLKNS